MDTAITAKVATSAIAVSALGFGFARYSERRRRQLLTDLHGGKGEAATAMATRVRHGRFSRLQRHRGEWLEAMCRSAVFGESGQSRSLLYAALAEAMAVDEYRKQIKSSLTDIQAIIVRNSPYMDLARARHRLFSLRAALNIDDDLRMRVERADIYSDQIEVMRTPDERCTDEAHRWGALKEVLRKRESVVVVCPRAERDGSIAGCATIALDFHKVAQITERVPVAATEAAAADTEAPRYEVPVRERFVLTESAKRLHHAKYRRNTTDISSLASELAGIIASHPLYEKAETIAVVSGRSHDCSVRLGTQTAHLAGKECVTFTMQKESDNQSDFMLAEPDLVRGKVVIIIDDVYRTGNTLRNAAQLLRGAGARQILGLTVTCTISAIIPQ